MNSMVLAFAGRIASGKSTVSQQVASTLGWSWVSFGAYVRAEAQRQGLNAADRMVLQQVSDQLLIQGWVPFCRAVLAQVNWIPGTPLVIDGIRHVEALETLRTLAISQDVCLVFVDTPESVRELRIRSRGVAVDMQRNSDKHTSETQVQSVLPQMAQLVVDGTQSLDRLTQEIVQWVIEYGSR